MATKLEQAQLDQLVRRVVEVAHPLEIILFGSAARGEMGPESDADVMIVVPEGTPARQTAQEVRASLSPSNLPFAVDVLVATPQQLARHKDDFGLIYYTVLREGREVYTVPAEVWKRHAPVDSEAQPSAPGPRPESVRMWMDLARQHLYVAHAGTGPDVGWEHACQYAEWATEDAVRAVLIS